MKSCVAAIDCGTTRTKAGIIRLDGRILGTDEQPSPCVRRGDGAVLFNPRQLLDAALGALRKALQNSRARPARVEAIAVTNQRASVLCVDRRGAALGPAFSWQDLRGTAALLRLQQRLPPGRFHAITGHPPHPVFTLGKLLWLRETDPTLFRRADGFALVQDFMLRQLGADHQFLDWSNASLTGLFDVKRRAWSGEILEYCRIRPGQLAQLAPPGQRVGTLSRRGARATGLLEGTPLVTGGGDQQCAALGAGAVRPGLATVTLGTAAAPLCHAARPTLDPQMRVICCSHADPEAWEVEGLQSSAGACLQWLASVISPGIFFSRAFLKEMGRLNPGAGGLLFLPDLAGASAPRWNPSARGAFLGLNLAHGRRELVRAIMEGVSMQTREILDVFHALRLPVREVRLTGGCAQIEEWNRIQADIYGLPVSTLSTPQATLLGAATLAACGIGAFPSVTAAVDSMTRVRRVYEPRPDRKAAYDRIFRRYKQAQDTIVAPVLSAGRKRKQTPHE